MAVRDANERRGVMGENTKIQWADHTFNPWRGCTKVAPGCANCYAESHGKRNPGTLGVWGPNGTRVLASESMWLQPVKWNRYAEISAKAWNDTVREVEGSIAEDGESYLVDVGLTKPDRPRVFCASLADAFEDYRDQLRLSDGRYAVTLRRGGQFAGFGGRRLRGGDDGTTLNDARAHLFLLIDATSYLDWLLLTKRPENIRRMLVPHSLERVPGHVSQNEGDGQRIRRRENLWLGTSIANQEDADRNIPELLKCRDLAAKLFVSVEPLVGPVDLSKWLGLLTYSDTAVVRMMPHGMTIPHPYAGQTRKTYESNLDWVIVGGESGPHASPCSVEWIRSIVRQCQGADVACFVKQLGAHVIGSENEVHELRNVCIDKRPGTDAIVRWKIRDPKGGDPSEWPEDLRVREVPT